MDIENCNICMPCAPTDSERELLDAMDSCSVNNQPLTIYISTLLERLTKEMILTKDYDEAPDVCKRYCGNKNQIKGVVDD